MSYVSKKVSEAMKKVFKEKRFPQFTCFWPVIWLD